MFNKSISICVGIAVLIPALPYHTTSARRLAIIVGVSGYMHPISTSTDGLESLKFAHRDACRVSAKLKELGWEVKTIQGLPETSESAAKKANILAALDSWRNTNPEDTVLFYFSGHGLRFGQTDFLCPADTTVRSSGQEDSDWVMDRSTLINVSDLGFDSVPARKRIVIMDACRAKPRGIKSPIKDEIDYAKFAERMHSRNYGLVSSAVLFSCSPSETSHEDVTLRSGLYTEAFLEALASPTVFNSSREVVLPELNIEIDRKIRTLVDAFNAREHAAIRMTPDSFLSIPPSTTIVLGQLGGATSSPDTDEVMKTALDLYARGRYAESRKLFEDLAGRGDGQSCYYLGLTSFHGTAVEKNQVEARKWWLQGAKAGDTASMNNLAYAYMTGSGGPIDNLGAFKWYAASAAAGDIDGMANIGNMFDRGIGTPVDKKLAMKWYIKSAAAGSSVGRFMLAFHYEYGAAIELNKARAIELYRLSAGQGHAQAAAALNRLGLRPRSAAVEKGIMEARQRALGLYDSGEYAKSLPFFKIAADLGDGSSCYYLGLTARGGTGAPQSNSVARDWWTKGAEAGDPASMNNLAWLLDNGVGAAVDHKAAFAMYQKSADFGDRDGMGSLARMYQSGLGVDKNYPQALLWAKKSGELGSGFGEFMLGYLYEHGMGVSASLNKAIECYRKAAAFGEQQARNALKRLNVG